MTSLKAWLIHRFDDPDRLMTSVCTIAMVGTGGVMLLWTWMIVQYYLSR